MPKKEAANSTCRNTIAVKSTKHKLSLKTHGLLPTRDLVVVVVVVAAAAAAAAAADATSTACQKRSATSNPPSSDFSPMTGQS